MFDPIPAPRPRVLWRRAAATIVDVLVVAGVGFALCALFFESFVGLGRWGQAIGLLLALAYTVPLDAHGGTLGKMAFGLRVARIDGNPPGMRHAFLRNAVRVGPWFLVDGSASSLSTMANLMAVLPVMVYLASVLLVAFDRSGQAIHDRAARTYVVPHDAFPVASVSSLRTAILAATPIVAATVLVIATGTSTKPGPRDPIWESVHALPSHPAVSVNANTMYRLPSGPSVRVLQVGATFTGSSEAAPGFAKAVAERVRAAGQDLSGYDSVQAVARRRAFLGIATLSKDYVEPVVVAGAGPRPAAQYEKFAAEGPENWAIEGSSHEVRTWFVRTQEKDGAQGLFYVVEWNCPDCDPRRITDARARQLSKPLYDYVCATGSWKRSSLSAAGGPVFAGNVAVQIVDRSAGSVFPHYGVVKKPHEFCDGATGKPR